MMLASELDLGRTTGALLAANRRIRVAVSLFRSVCGRTVRLVNRIVNKRRVSWSHLTLSTSLDKVFRLR